MDVDDPPPAGQVGGELRQGAKHLLEEDRDVLSGEPLDGYPVAIRSRADGCAGPEELGDATPIHGRDDRVAELSAEIVGPVPVQERAGHSTLHGQAPILEHGQIVRIRGPRPGVDRRSMRPRGGGQRRRRDTRRSRGPDRGEQPELQPEVDQPGPVEATKAGDEVVEAIVGAHSPRLSHGRVPSTRARRVPYGDATVRRGRWFCGVMDTTDALHTDRLAADARLTSALSRDLDGAFPTLVSEHQDRLYSIALRMLGDPHDAEEAAQDALVRAYRALAGYDPATDRATCGSGAGSRPSC